MRKTNLNGNIYQKLEYFDNQLKKYESEKKSLLKSLSGLQGNKKKRNKNNR